MKRSRGADYWCLPQTGGHPTLYFQGHKVISRAEYIEVVGAPDCDPHVATGSRTLKKPGRRKAKSTRKSTRLRSLGDGRKVGSSRSGTSLRSTGDARPVR
jgi:hypothetical protein